MRRCRTAHSPYPAPVGHRARAFISAGSLFGAAETDAASVRSRRTTTSCESRTFAPVRCPTRLSTCTWQHHVRKAIEWKCHGRTSRSDNYTPKSDKSRATSESVGCTAPRSSARPHRSYVTRSAPMRMRLLCSLCFPENCVSAFRRRKRFSRVGSRNRYLGGSSSSRTASGG